MPPSGKKRHKFALEPISIDELYGSSTMKGLLSFMDNPPLSPLTSDSLLLDTQAVTSDSLLLATQGVTSDNVALVTPCTIDIIGLQTKAIQPDTSVRLTPVMQRSATTNSESSTLNDTSAILKSGDTDSQDDTSAILAATPLPSFQYQTQSGTIVGEKLLRPWKNTQDAHTPAEHLLYNFLYGRANKGREAVRVTYLEMHKGTGISRRQAIRITQALQDKMALEMLEIGRADDKSGSVYRVHSMVDINESRRRTGYLYVYRNRTSVELARIVQPVTSVSLTPVQPVTSVNLSLVTSVSLSPATSVSLSPLLENKKLTEMRTSSDDCTQLLETLTELTGPCDENAAVRLLADCRRAAPDAELSEIVEHVRIAHSRAVGRREIVNLRGLILATVPAMFQSRPLQLFRKQRQDRIAAELEHRRRERQDRIRAAQEVLADPTTTQDLRDWATGILDEAELQE